jgi:hypothetical protein
MIRAVYLGPAQLVWPVSTSFRAMHCIRFRKYSRPNGSRSTRGEVRRHHDLHRSNRYGSVSTDLYDGLSPLPDSSDPRECVTGYKLHWTMGPNVRDACSVAVGPFYSYAYHLIVSETLSRWPGPDCGHILADRGDHRCFARHYRRIMRLRLQRMAPPSAIGGILWGAWVRAWHAR